VTDLDDGSASHSVNMKVTKVGTREAIVWLLTRFASVQDVGTRMVVRAAGAPAVSDATTESCAVLRMEQIDIVVRQTLPCAVPRE